MQQDQPIPTFCQYSFELPTKEAAMTGIWLYSPNFLILVAVWLHIRKVYSLVIMDTYIFEVLMRFELILLDY